MQYNNSVSIFRKFESSIKNVLCQIVITKMLRDLLYYVHINIYKYIDAEQLVFKTKKVKGKKKLANSFFQMKKLLCKKTVI